MKTEEDEAFDELAKRQGDWGGGFQAKRAMAADRFKDGIQWWMDTKTYGAYPNPPQWHIDTGNLVRLVPAQPAQDGKCKYCVDGCIACDARSQPAQEREWVGLTDEETQAYWDWEDWQTGAGRSTIFEMVRDIEAKLKEKNNG